MTVTGGQLFLDETKRRDYLLVAAAVPPGDLQPARRLLRGLVLPGQRRLHMNAESDPRRRVIADAVLASGITAVVYDAGRRYPTERDRRRACLHAVVRDAAANGDSVLVLEQDDTLLDFDRRQLYQAVRDAGCADTLRYEHRRAATEQLLAVPDVIAWCWAKGGHWRHRIEPAVTHTRTV